MRPEQPHAAPATEGEASRRWPVVDWIDQSEASEIEYASYWNDVSAEREKPWWVLTGDFSAMERYLGEVGLPADLELALASLPAPLRGRGADLAAGTLWAAPRLLASEAVERVYCVEYSRHRLLEVGPRVLEHYGVDPARVVLAFGSFYALCVPDGSLDFAFMSQAFHHADDPDRLLAELRRALRPGGVVIIIGEHVVAFRDYARHVARLAGSIPRRLRGSRAGTGGEPPSVRPTGCELVPTDPVLGDHVYTRREYREMFDRHGFDSRRLRRRGSSYQGFVLVARPAQGVGAGRALWR